MHLKVRVVFILLSVTGMCVFWRTYMSQCTPAQVRRLCGCGLCSSENDPWFIRRFNKSVEPFLSANYQLTEDNFNWWKHLKVERRSFNNYRKTVENLFQMFPHNPDVVAPSPDHCRTCAVVGNSGKSHYGPLIDIDDVIIRMNAGRIQGYEADVGVRTTHRIMYPESAVDLDNTTHLVLVPFKLLDLEWVIKALSTVFFWKVMVINPAFMRYVHDKWLQKKGRYPSTGFMALILAIHICDEVHVFGYGADSDGNWSHYWEKLLNRKTGIHPWNDEYEIIQELHFQQRLTFYTGR